LLLLALLATSPVHAYESEGQPFHLELLTKRDAVIWGFDFLPDGRILFTERAGALNVFDPKTRQVTAIAGAPPVWAHGQGGLLDVRVDPRHGDRIFLTYAEPVGADRATTAVAAARLAGARLTDLRKIFTATPPAAKPIQFGSRIEFDPEGRLFVSIGDLNQRNSAQDLSTDLGKIVRLNEDGSPAAGNPFAGRAGARPEIWSYGHRSPEGLVRHPTTGELWMSEMGPRGGDEVNLVKPGANYGWPLVTYGREYFGPRIGVESKPGTVQPVAYWVPSISPAAMAFYGGQAFPKWKGNAFLACLSGTQLRRLIFEGDRVVRQEALLVDQHARFRTVRPGPDGLLYLSTDDGRLTRLVPGK
jgi:glucose/arabinose dehydrogenase